MRLSRRRFLQEGPLAIATVSTAQVQSARTLNVFGLTCPVDNDGVVAKPSDWAGEWNVLVVNGRATCKFSAAAADFGGVALQVAVRFRVTGESGELRIADGPHDQDKNALVQIWQGTGVPIATLAIAAGAIRLRGQLNLTAGIVGQSGTIWVESPVPPQDSANHSPLRIEGGLQRLTLDLSARTVRLKGGFFRVDTVCRFMRDSTTLEEHFLRRWQSRDVAIPLITPAASTVVLFDADVPGDLHLNVRAAGPRLQLPISATDAALGVRLTRSEGTIIISDAWLEPAKGDSFGLRTELFADALNRPAAWRVTSRLSLSLRAGTEQSPSSLLIRCGRGEPREQDAEAASLRFDGTSPLHGGLRRTEFHVNGVTRLTAFATGAGADALQGVDSRLVWRDSTPLIFVPTSSEVRHPRTGDVQQQPKSNDIEPYRFVVKSLPIPLLPTEWAGPDGDPLRRRIEEFLAERQQLEYPIERTLHETGFAESTPAPLSASATQTAAAAAKPLTVKAFNWTLRQKLERSDATEPALVLADHVLDRDFGAMVARSAIRAGTPRDYVIIREGDSATTLSVDPKRIVLETGTADFRVTGGPRKTSNTSLPLAVVKLTRRFTLEEILQDEGFANPVIHADGSGELIPLFKGYISPELESQEWTGVIAFNVPVTLGDTKFGDLLKKLVPSTLSLGYLAITPGKTGGGGSGNVWARLTWRARQAAKAPADLESGFRSRVLDATWQTNELTACSYAGSLAFNGLLGIKFAQQSNQVDVSGKYDRLTREMRFDTHFDKPQPLLGKEGLGPLESAAIESVDVGVKANVTSLAINGSITFKNITLQDLKLDRVSDGVVNLRRMSIALDAFKEGWRSFAIDYAALEWPQDLPVLSFGFIGLSLSGLLPQLPKGPEFDWGAYPLPIGKTDKGWSGCVFKFRAKLMKLSDIARNALDRVDFEVAFGVPSVNAPVVAGISLSAIHNFELDLFRFLQVKADNLALKPREVVDRQDQTRVVPWLEMQNVTISAGGTKFVDKLSLFMFTADGRTGFLGYLGAPVSFGIGRFEWLLIAHGVAPSVTLSKQLIEVDVQGAGDNDKHRERIKALDDPKSFKGELGGEQWLLAAGFDLLNGTVIGKVLLYESRFYGVCLSGKFLKDLLGYDAAISVLYIKGRSSQEDTFSLSFKVPIIQTPGFMFNGGVVRLDVSPNGDFFLDLGFPWAEPSGRRQWERTFGAIVTPWQGSGGFYIRKYTVKTPTADGLVVGAGLAVQFGLGGAYGGGVLKVYATVGIYGIGEGIAYITGTKIAGLHMVGAIGLLGRAVGQLDWWVISITVEIVLSAEARLTISWGGIPSYQLTDGTTFAGLQEASDKVKVRFDFLVYAGARAEACVGWGPFRACAGIEVVVPIQFGGELSF